MLRSYELSQIMPAFVPFFTKRKTAVYKMTKRPAPTFYVGVPFFAFDKNWLQPSLDMRGLQIEGGHEGHFRAMRGRS